MPEIFKITAIAGWTAGVLSLAAFIPYIAAIMRGQTTPNRATWLIWTIIGIAAGSSYYAAGAGDTAWVALSYIAGPSIIFILSISLLTWRLSGSALLGLCMSLVADLMAASPTIVKAYLKPQGEDRPSWTIWSVAGAINLVAIDDWGALSIVVYPIYMLLCAGTIAALLWLRPSHGVKS